MRVRSLLFVVPVLATVLISPPVSASPVDTARAVTVRDLNGVGFGAANVATVRVCDDTPVTPVCFTDKVPASGVVTVYVDSTKTYTVSATAYNVFSSAPIPLDGDEVIDVPGAGPPRVVNGTITVNGSPESDAGLLACLLPCTSGYIVGLGDATGFTTIRVNSLSSYVIDASAELFTINQFKVNPPAGTSTITVNANIVLATGTTFQGTVHRTGFTTFPTQTAGVFACPNAVIGPPGGPNGNLCHGLRFAYAATDGTYRLRLGTPPAPAAGYSTATGYNLGGFMIIDGVPVTTGVTTSFTPPGPVSISQDFYADLAQVPSTTQSVGTGADAITLTGAAGALLSNVATAPTSATVTPLPSGVVFEHGIQSFTAALAPGETTATITLTFVGVVAPNAQWFKLRNGAWASMPFPYFERVDSHTIRLAIPDGSEWDLDGIANGYVTDPGALGTTAGDGDGNGIRDTPPPTTKDQCKGAGWRAFDNPSFRNQGSCVSFVQARR